MKMKKKKTSKLLHDDLFKWPPEKPKKAAKDVHWNKPIKRNRKEQLTLEEIHYRHEKNRMDQMKGWPKPDHKHYTPVSNVAKKDIVEELEEYLARQDDDPNIQLLNECIEGASKRISLYKMLQNGMWYATFKCDSKDEILRERMLIKEFINMKEDVIQWNKKQLVKGGCV